MTITLMRHKGGAAAIVTSIILFAALVIITAPAFAVDPAPLPAQIRDAKKIHVQNLGVEDYVFDRVFDQLKRWGRFTIVEDVNDADLIIAALAVDHFYGMLPAGSTTTATASATTIGNTTTAQGTATTTPMHIPLMTHTRYLMVVDPKTATPLLTVQTPVGFLLSKTAKSMVDKLKGRFPKSER